MLSIEDFVFQFNEKTQSEKVEWGVKDKKNPTDVDIQELENVMGTDHREFNSSFFKGMSGGEGSGAAVPNVFAKVSSAKADGPVAAVGAGPG
eukprot:1890100-Heterocapsa_arctica.AAC.1